MTGTPNSVAPAIEVAVVVDLETEVGGEVEETAQMSSFAVEFPTEADLDPE